jgi:hypothetical protein
MIMNHGELVILLLFLTVLFFVPIVIIQLVGRRRPSFKPNLLECPNCGADNHQAKSRCYCCGHDFGSSPTEGDVIQRVKQAEDSRRRRSAAAEIPGAIVEKPLPGARSKEE